jgi:hypothetical protein
MSSLTIDEVLHRMASERPSDIGSARTLLAPFVGCRDLAGIASSSPEQVRDVLRSHLVASIPGFMGPDECQELAATVSATLDDTGRGQDIVAALGGAWFQYFDGDPQEYFARAEEDRLRIQALGPDLYPRVLDVCARIVGAPVRLRPGWSGPGFVLFRTAQVHGSPGDVHFDWDGLMSSTSCPVGVPSYSMVCMLQRPEGGGSLAVWNAAFAPDPGDHAHVPLDQVLVDYVLGDLIVFDAYQLHQIQPLWGMTDRIALTLHVGLADEGWEAWL